MIIFDCDGVLADSEILSNAIDAELMTEAGHAVTAEELISGYIGQPKAAIWAAIARERGEVWPEGLVERAEQRLLERIAAELQPVDGVADALAAIGRRKAVASSSSLPKLRLALQKTGLLANFDPDIFSASQVARGKPAPDVFLYAASQCGVAPGELHRRRGQCRRRRRGQGRGHAGVRIRGGPSHLSWTCREAPCSRCSQGSPAHGSPARRTALMSAV